LNITPGAVDVAERLADLAMKIFLFLFVLAGVSVMTYFFIYCEMTDKGVQAKAVSAYGDAVFFTAFGTLVYYFFSKKGRPK
jgi:putative effector of murein hydrolase LrgA (UPF0299 family)